jgi:ATP-dependent Clp protease ATP-binding subunit ClpC
MYERFTDRARKVMVFANQEAHRFGHEYIGTEHILLGLVMEGSGVAASALKNLKVDLTQLRCEVDKLSKRGSDSGFVSKLPTTPQAKRVIEHAITEARGLNHHYIGTEHLLLGLLGETGEVAAIVLTNLGLSLESVRREVLDLVGGGLDAKVPTEAADDLIQQAIKSLSLAGNKAISEGNEALASTLFNEVEHLRALLGAQGEL